MTPENFIINYQSALASQDWLVVSPLIMAEASVTFSDGSVHSGKIAIQAAYERNFNAIKSEKYSILNVSWLRKEKDFAVYQFDFEWSGFFHDELVSGSGIGTSVIIRTQEKWMLLTEHLGRKSK